MKKSILLVITILMMIFGIITNVYAETCTSNYYDKLDNQLSFSESATIGKNTFRKNFVSNGTISFNNVNYIKGQLWYVITDQNTMISNINLETSCTQSHLENMVPDMIITYADGTHADIDGSTYELVCDIWQTRQVNQTLFISNEPNIKNIGLSINTSSGSYSCEVDSNGNFSCPVVNNWQYNSFTYRINLEKRNASIKFGIMSSVLNTCISDSQQIINNQNQNTTTINNNITNLNDNITSSTISSQTTSDVGNISNNLDSGSKNVILDFMLMPITFIQNLLDSFNNSCATLCIGECGSGHDNDWRFVFPCIDLQSILGSTIYNLIDLLMTFGMVFAFVRSVVGFLKKALLLENDMSSEVQIF